MDEFLKMLSISDVMGDTMSRYETGRRTWRYAWGSVKPMARAALRSPFGRESMPARTCSHTRAAVKNPRPSVPVTKAEVAGGCANNHARQAGGRSFGAR